MDDGGPAFPVDGTYGTTHGMTLRDYFAAKALQGMLADTSGDIEGGDSVETYAEWAYRYASAMLKARQEGQK